MMLNLDLRKKLQDQANDIVNKALEETPLPIEGELITFLKNIIFLAIKTGYLWGVTTQMQIADTLLKDLSGVEFDDSMS